MKKSLFTILCTSALLLPTYASAETNVILEKDFWKDVTLAKIEAQLTDPKQATVISDSDFTPLLYAARYAAPEAVINRLIDAGADVNRIGHDQRTAIFYAAYSGTLDTVNTLLKHQPDLTVRDNSNRSPLLFSFYGQQDPAVFERLMQLGLSLEDVDGSGRNAALIAAQRSSSLEVVQFLQQHKVDFSLIDNDGRGIALNAASRNSNLEVVKAFIGDSNIRDIKDNQGQNVLHVAAYRNGSVDIINYLLSAGVEVNALDNQSRNALNIAAVRNSEAVFQRLLDLEIDPNHSDAQGKTPLLYATSRDAGSDKKAASTLAIIEALVAHKADINALDQANNSVLINAVKSQQPLATLAYLIAQGADVNTVNKDGLTALMTAAMMSKDEAVISLLLQHNANVAQADDFEETALDLIKDNDNLANSPVVALLEAATKR